MTAVLKIGAIQAYIAKFASSMFVLVWWCTRVEPHGRSATQIFYSTLLVLIIAGLQFTQMYVLICTTCNTAGYRLLDNLVQSTKKCD